MTIEILLRDGVSRQAASSGMPHKIDGLGLEESVSVLRAKAAPLLQLKAEEINLVYCGRILHDDVSLASCGLASGSIVLALKKTPSLKPSSEHGQQFDSTAMQQLSTAIKIRTHRNFRPTLEAVLSNPSTVHNIVESNQRLAADPTAVALLRDADLLMLTLSDSTSRLRVFEAHPALCDAVVELMSLVSKDLNEKPATAVRQQYNLDRMDAEEDVEEEDDETEINSNMLMNLQRDPQQRLITADFFRQAILAATADGAGTSASSVPSAAVVTEDQLQQLRDMGITDEALARRALEASGGDIQAALEFIFGDDM